MKICIVQQLTWTCHCHSLTLSDNNANNNIVCQLPTFFYWDLLSWGLIWSQPIVGIKCKIFKRNKIRVRNIWYMYNQPTISQHPCSSLLTIWWRPSSWTIAWWNTRSGFARWAYWLALCHKHLNKHPFWAKHTNQIFAKAFTGFQWRQFLPVITFVFKRLINIFVLRRNKNVVSNLEQVGFLYKMFKSSWATR